MPDFARYINRSVSHYLKGQIESGDPSRTKRGLQQISKLYRRGGRFIQDQLVGVENEIIGLMFSSPDAKVRRWALNALAQLGRCETCRTAVLHALQAYHADAEVLAAAIAALYRLCEAASQELRKMGFNEQMVTLAALQHIPANRLDLSCLPLHVERADPELIKLGLIVVGVNRAPPNMFEPNYENAEIVRALGSHHDPLVSQYSVWAITENPNLGIASLGIRLEGIEQRPPNVRGWVFQLLAIDSADTGRHLEYIKLGIDDESAEARLGLAVGLKDSFSAVLVPLVLDWFTRERDLEVRSQILDHLILHSRFSPTYEDHVLGEFGRANADARDRMLATAAGTPLHSRLSEIKYNGTGRDLFRGAGMPATNTTFNISTLHAGSVAMGGNANQSGNVSNTYNGETLQMIQSHLLDAERELEKCPSNLGARKEAMLAIQDARKATTKDNLARVVAAMGKVEELAIKVLGTGTAIAGIAKLLAQAAGIG